MVQWTWEAPKQTASKYSVQETTTATNLTMPEDGFSSGAKLERGQLKYWQGQLISLWSRENRENESVQGELGRSGRNLTRRTFKRHLNLYTHNELYIYTYIYIYAYIHIYTHIHIYIHIYITTIFLCLLKIEKSY